MRFSSVIVTALSLLSPSVTSALELDVDDPGMLNALSIDED